MCNCAGGSMAVETILQLAVYLNESETWLLRFEAWVLELNFEGALRQQVLQGLVPHFA